MRDTQVFTVALLLSVVVEIRTQFYDFFPGWDRGLPSFQYQTTIPPFIQNYKPYDIYNNVNNNNRRTNNNNINKSTTKKYEDPPIDVAFNQDIPFSSFINVPDSDRGNNFFSTNNNNNRVVTTTTTTVKPRRRTQSSQNNRNNNRRTQVTNNQWVYEETTKKPINDYPKNNNVYDDTINNNRRHPNNNFDKTTVKPKTYDKNDRYTTQNPFYNHPGVKPTVFYNGPPITNKPIRRPFTERPVGYTERPSGTYTERPSGTYTERPSGTYTERPSGTYTERPTASYTERPVAVARPSEDGFTFPKDQDDGPELVTGPDVDYISEGEKRSLYDLTERMCDKYQSQDYKQVQAIPLLPSPDVVRVNVSQCSTATPLIVGGRTVTVEQFPHQAALGWRSTQGNCRLPPTQWGELQWDGVVIPVQYLCLFLPYDFPFTGKYLWKCGGSLISDQFVLTAAHCAYQDRDNSISLGPPQVVQLGSTYLYGSDAKLYPVAKAIRHPKYKLPKSYYDVALLKLTTRVTFSEKIKPACLGDPPAAGQKIFATGWGKTEFGGDQSHELRGVSIPIWDLQSCREALGTSRKLPDGVSAESQICAGEYEGRKDTCQGDSGGGAVVRSRCIWRVLGVTSLGRGCGAPRTPALYAIPDRLFIAKVAFSDERF